MNLSVSLWPISYGDIFISYGQVSLPYCLFHDPGGPEGDRAQGQVSTICREGRAQLAEGREMLKGTIERTTRNESVADLLGLCMVMSSKLM